MKRINKAVLLSLCTLFSIVLLCSCGGGGGGGGSSSGDSYGQPSGKSSYKSTTAFPGGFYGYWKNDNFSNQVVFIAPNSYTEYTVSGYTMTPSATYNCSISAGESGTVSLSAKNYQSSSFSYTITDTKLTLSNTKKGASLTKAGSTPPYSIVSK